MHRYEAYDGTPLRNALERALAELEANDEVAVRTAHTHVVGALCERVAAAGLLRAGAAEPAPGTRAGMAAYLERVTREGIAPAEWQEQMAMHYADGTVEEARRQAVLLHLRLQQGGVTAEQAAEYFRALARGLRGAAT